MILRSHVGVCLLAASLGAPSIAFAEANDASIPAQLNRINEAQKACSGEAATQALDQLRESVVQAANSGKISRDVGQSALGAIDKARSALNSDSLKAISGALLAVGQQVKTVEAQASDAARRVEGKVADATQRVENRVAEAQQNATQTADQVRQHITKALSELKPDDVTGQTLYDNAGNAVANVRSVRTAANGQIEAVEIDVGGFFGLGKKQIFVPVNDLSFRDGRIEASSLTADQIRNLPQTASNEAQQTVGQRAEQLGQKASDAAHSAESKVADAARRVENKVADAAKNVETKVADAARNVENRVAGTAQNASEASRQVSNAAQGPTIAISDLKERDVLGSTLYDRGGNAVANILRVQSAPDGRIEAIIVDAGGFLGLGSKRIVIPVDRLQFRAGRIDAPSLTLEEIHNLPQAAQ